MKYPLLLSIGRGPTNCGGRRDEWTLEEALPTAVVFDCLGNILLRDSHITEVQQETTDDA